MESNHLSYDSHPWEWTTHSINYTEMERLTRPLAAQLVAHVDKEFPLSSPHSSALDDGCGTGMLSSTLKEFCPEIPILAIDTSVGMIDAFKARAKEGCWEKTSSRVMDGRKLNGVPDASITHTFSTFVVCLAADPASIADEVYRVTSRGGIFGLATWSDPYFSYWSVPWTNACQRLNPDYKCPMIIDPAWTYESSVQSSLTKAGFQDIKTYSVEGLWKWDSVDAATKYFFDGANPRVREYHRSWEASGGRRDDVKPLFAEALKELYCKLGTELVATVGAVLATARKH